MATTPAVFAPPRGQQVNSALEAFNVKLLPNPNLKPEESRNIELGLRTRLNNLSLEVAVFSGKYTNLIQEKKNFGTLTGSQPAPPTPRCFKP
jgi:hemoglobin/transferrin/lactoferrin receptor protein